MPITALPALIRTSATFKADVDTYFGTLLPNFASEANATAAALNLASTNDTSATSQLIATGAKTFTVTSGKSFQPGMYLVIADTAAPSTNSMFGQVTSYATNQLVMNILSVRGSGTKTAWVISQSSSGFSMAADIGNTPAGGVAGATVQQAIDELDTEKAAKGANTDITSLAGLTTALSIPQGGSGAATAAAARANLGALSLEFMHVRDEKAAGTSGGASVAGNQTRTLNTVVSNTIVGASLAANQVTLPAGTYRVYAAAPAYKVNNHRLRLINVTDASAVVLLGSNEFTGGTSDVSASSVVVGRFVLAAAKVLQLTNFTQAALATNGLGAAVSDTFVEVYASMMICKE